MNILYAMSTKSDFERKTFCVKIAVDLLARSWVEIFSTCISGMFSTVDLLARSWVEMPRRASGRFPDSSTSLRGRELKYNAVSNRLQTKCRPPCEVVSWNSIASGSLALISRRPPCEVVSWNRTGVTAGGVGKVSTSLRGRELKCLSYVL